MDEKGNIFYTDQDDNKIYKYDISQNYKQVFIEYGIGSNIKVCYPTGITLVNNVIYFTNRYYS